MKKLPLILVSLLAGGCASFTSSLSEGHPNRKEIAVTPGATVVTLAKGAIVDEDRDGLVIVPRGAGPFRPNVGRVEKDGYQIGVLQRRMNWWIAGNWVYGGFPGLFIDFIDGAAYSPTVVYLSNPVSMK
jgi:hypothetical protein